jgi:hypothetical protein
MIHSNRYCLCVLLLLAWAVTASAQTADQLIKRHLKAVGGANQLRRIENTICTGTVTNPVTEQTGRFVMRLKRPDRLMTEMEVGGFESSAAYNGRSAWRRDSRDGLRTLTALDGARFKADALYRNDHFLNYKRDKLRVALVGRAPVNEREALVLELTTPQALKRKVYFDAQSYLILREEQETAAGTEVISYGDYRKVDEVLEPHSIELRSGDSILRVTLNQVEHNRPLAEAIFGYPPVSGAPLPDVATLLRELGQHQQHNDALLENYSYTEVLTERTITNKGEVTERDSTTKEISHYLGEQIERLVKRGGQPLSPEEDAKQLKQFEKRIHEIEAEKQKYEERKRKRDEARARGERVKEEEEDTPDLAEFLRVCDFVNPRRERFRGREVIVFDFQPKPNVKARNLGESLVQKLVGVMWVDAEAKEVARLEAHFNDKLKIAGGLLATIQPGSALVLEQEHVNNEVWLPSYASLNLSARLLLFKGINANVSKRYSDYKKFKVDSKSELKNPDAEKKP